MKRKYLYFFVIFVLSLFIYSSSPNSFYKYDKVDAKLKTDAYSYLSPAEKDYIRSYYAKNGVILPTEKNHKENEVYFNPSYGLYLNLSNEEKQEVGDIPLPITIESNAVPVESDYLPATYDLRNIGGISDIKNQGNLGLCWAFTTVEQAESYLLVTKGETFNSSTSQTFSVRQMDYATAENALYDYDGVNRHYTDIGLDLNDEPVSRKVGDSGNFLVSSKIAAEAVSLVDNSKMPYNDTDKSRKELVDVLNYDNSLYELNSSVAYVQIGHTLANYRHKGLDPNDSSDTKDGRTLSEFVSSIKEKVRTYGGAYVASQSPGKSCSYNRGNGDHIIRVDESCIENSGHAMQIIGWDDNYTYSYCKSGDSHTSPTNCSSSNLVSGTGAWILRNSWGDNNTPYIHLAYDTYYEAVFVGTNYSHKSERNWDNSYIQHINTGDFSAGSGTQSVTFTKTLNTPEKVTKIKFHTFAYNVTADISVVSDASPTNTNYPDYTNSERKEYNYIKTVTISEPGYVTVDISDANAIVTGQTFTIKIRTPKNQIILPETISAFTENVDDDPLMYSSHLIFEPSNLGYTLRFDPITKNIPSNADITYVLKDIKGADYTNKLISYNYSKVSENNMNAYLTISGTIPYGLYTLGAIYNGHMFETKLLINKTFNLSGKGTEAEPFLITNEEDLRMMQFYLDGDYKLTNDIVLSDYWMPIGNKDNPFRGSFDGDGHSIINLTVKNEYEYSGLFGYVKSNDYDTNVFKNVRFVNADVKGTVAAGTLIGSITAREGYGSWNKPIVNISIDNVHLLGGNIYSNTGIAGALIGSIDPARDTYQYHGKHNYTLNKIYSSSNVGGYSASGFIGLVKGSWESNSTVKPTISIKNVENVGVINLNYLRNQNITPVNGTHSSMVGKLSKYMDFTISQYISSPLYLGFSNSDIYGYKDSQASFTKTKGYNVLDNNITVSSLKNAGMYSTWTDFNTYWEIPTVNGVKRMPIIKGANILYTPSITASDIKTTDNIVYVRNMDGITGNPIYYRFSTTGSTNPSVLDTMNVVDSTSNQVYDVGLIPVSGGNATVHLVSNYDGYEVDLDYTVLAPITSFSVVNETSVSLYVGDQHQITTSIVPDNTYEDKTVTWATGNQFIATVSTTGKITARASGTTVITGRLENNKEVSVTVTVIQPVPIERIGVSRETVYLAPGAYKTITTLITPTYATESLTWTSLNPNIATVNSNGKITGVSEGTTTVTVSSPGNISKTIDVIVEQSLRNYIKGDDDYNSVVDLNDIVIALRKIYEYEPKDQEDYQILDINNNNSIDLNDIVAMLRYIYEYDESL